MTENTRHGPLFLPMKITDTLMRLFIKMTYRKPPLRFHRNRPAYHMDLIIHYNTSFILTYKATDDIEQDMYIRGTTNIRHNVEYSMAYAIQRREAKEKVLSCGKQRGNLCYRMCIAEEKMESSVRSLRSR